jgi:hypothetical protein
MTLLSVSTLCCRRWCSSATTPTMRREPSRSSSVASSRSTSRSLARSSLCWTSPRCQSMNHNLSRGLSPSTGSYISLRNSGRPDRVTGRRGSPLPRRAAVSTASRARRVEAPRPGWKDVPRVAPAETPTTTRSRHKTTPDTTVASLTIGPRSVDSHDAAKPTSHRCRGRSQLYSEHTQALSYL